MNIYSGKPLQHKNRSAANTIMPEKTPPGSSLRITSKRPETIRFQKLQAIANSSIQAMEATRLQSMAGNYGSGHLASVQPKVKKIVPGTPAAMPVQMVPKTVEVSWGVTHLVRKMNNSIFGGDDFKEGEAGREGEVVKGQTLIIDDEHIFTSRRGPNQEIAENRNRDKVSEPGRKWYLVLSLNGMDIANQKLYIREETFIDYKGELSSKEKEAKDKTNVYWIAHLVRGLLKGLQYRTGGSYAARMEHGAARTPKDIDLEFWSYEEAMKAKDRFSRHNVKEDEKMPYPQLMYFLPQEEKNVSITMLAMGMKNKGQGRPMPLLTIELNNENHRQGDNDFKKKPSTRHAEQPRRMRKNSLIAGSIERLSYTLLLKEEDTKQDEAFLKHIIGTMKGMNPAEIYADVMSRFDLEMIKNPPAPDKSDEESDEELSEEIDHTKRLEIIKRKLKELLGLK